MKILIIGSKGFIGENLISYYKKQSSIEVWGCDVVTDYPAKNYFLIDSSNSDFNEVFIKQKFDVCINCSGSASVPISMENPSRDYHLNVLNVFNILDAIRKHQPECKFLNLSSAAVYGNPKSLPIKEDDLTSPLSPYGWHKLQSELLCKEFNQLFKIKCCSLRIFSAFGVGLKKQLFWDLYQKTLSSSHLGIYGTGNESRDFIYVDDLVEAISCVVARGAFDGDIYNIANGEEIQIKSIVESFVKQFPTKLTFGFSNEIRSGDPMNWCADISKLKHIGYKQQITFDEGVKKVLKWFLTEKK